MANFRRSIRRKTDQISRQKTELPADIVDSLILCIGDLFYPDRYKTSAAVKRWSQDRHWYRQRVILWAAAWLDSKGVTLPPDRFKQILLDKLTDIRRNAPEKVLNFPRYITHSIQDHFHHHTDALYDEAKAFTNQLQNALAKLPAPGVAPMDPIRVLAEAHRLLKPARKSALKTVAKTASQPDLF